MSKLRELIEHVRQNSPFYSEQWRDVVLPQDADDDELLRALPVTDHKAYWEANTCRDSRVLTAPQGDGIIFKTGGTTGNPKVAFYSHQELDALGHMLATCLARCGVGYGDKVANLFYAGDMYGSFLLHIYSVHYLPGGAVQVPIAGHVGIPTMVEHIVGLETSVVLGTVTTMCKIADYLLETDASGRPVRQEAAEVAARHVRLLLFSGEALYPDQMGVLAAAFPGARIRSVVYGSMDSGIVGLAPPQQPDTPPPEPAEAVGVRDDKATAAPLILQDKTDQRVHSVNSEWGVIVQIVTEDGRVTTTAGEEGSIVVTNTGRRLMPAIRYPSGDRGAWVDHAQGLFRVLGRDRTAVRVGPVSVDFVHLRDLVAAIMGPERPVAALQLRVGRCDAKDQLTVLVAYRPESRGEEADLRRSIREALDEARPIFKGHVDADLICPLEVEFVDSGEVVMSERSGKVVDVIDVRAMN
ncbi:hypothetical protein M0657_010189 [Pyricularia oryzae]|uniref:AMP-dependent synthetase/ligase domain-containing protein n=4 Tax=Pyricularia oryzae TaxID=318829 RepID=Q2KGW5_PYRO7|nr:hypothetical protein 7bg7.10 [Pyricularia oryzae]EAQ70813.1 hypothetical protein MGCH7_ch7g220 [Pyricularia oryzae 70-15]ELQ40556.1 hypothetical protein OOU_Y34scaffold00420g11 [Pyricularia oryzae Y34]KAI7911460.1 hypothetical protein M9X92_010503 [Pyricularia oryzae]KAI7913035.1 hypothetical protein M0657_010189 [Pyricularia oryzae]